VQGTASVADKTSDAARELELVEQRLDAAVRAFTGLEDVDSARERLLELQAERDEARERLDELRAAASPALTLDAGRDFDSLSLDGQRALIRAVVDRAVVAPGRGSDRITVEPRVE
jgi:hypothetical protein